MEKFWMVWRVDGPGPTHRHETEASAVTEAQRLARSNPAMAFVVLEATDRFWMEPPPVMRESLETKSWEPPF